MSLADKNWLIRTKNRQILGPATKQKVIELLEKGSLSGDDEVTCGNGYWFWVRERDLIEKYLYGDLPQSFNPISEAEDALTAKSTADGITASMTATPAAKPSPKSDHANKEGENLLPENDDLAYPDDNDLGYPDMGTQQVSAAPVAKAPVKPAVIPSHSQEKNTPPVSNLSLEAEPLLDSDDNTLFPKGEDLEYPEVEVLDLGSQEQDPDSTAEIKSNTIEQARDEFEDVTDPNIEIPDILAQEDEVADNEEFLEEQEAPVAELKKLPPVKSETQGKKRRKKTVKSSSGNDRYLIYIGMLLLIVIGVIIYYFKVIINKPIPYIGITSVQAQTLSSLSKKKTL